MKAQELRIGNLLQGSQGSVTVTQILEKNYVTIKGAGTKFEVGVCLKAIPLTEEWFNRFNYTKDENCNYYSNVHGLQIYKKSNGNGYYCEHEYAFLCSLDFVHHLQNLHFDLYNEELK